MSTIRLSNILSISNKYTAVKLFCSTSDVTGLVETKDCSTNPDNWFADLRSHNVSRRPRNKNGGGVALIIRRSLRGFRRTDLEPASLEAIFVESFVLNLIFCVFYGSLWIANKHARPTVLRRRSLPQTFSLILLARRKLQASPATWTRQLLPDLSCLAAGS